MFIGIGHDIHRLRPVRDLILGGVKIPHERGLMGHSDADVLTHSIVDALLGASGLGDIGEHFPDDDPQYSDASSIDFLAHTIEMIRENGFRIQNIDATVFAEAPKLTPYKDQIRKNLAGILDMDMARINIKAKTMEGLGEIGRREGISATSVVLLEKAGTQA
jgi:2-C-methyl-D-erythritol 2,4-cyclodiphosphate synthase